MFNFVGKELLRIGIGEHDRAGVPELRIQTDGPVFASSRIGVWIKSSDYTVEHAGGCGIVTVVLRPDFQDLVHIRAAIDCALRHLGDGTAATKKKPAAKKKARSGK